MILTLSGADEARRPELFRDMYRQRHDIFVERRGWRQMAGEARLERDHYDGPDATYILLLDRGGSILASARLLSTLGPHLLGDIFPHLVDGCAPRGCHAYEITRFYLAERATAGIRRQRIERLSRAIFDHCAAQGISTLSSVVDTFMLPIMERHGWVFEPLGAAQPYGEGSAVAVVISVSYSRAAMAGGVAPQKHQQGTPWLQTCPVEAVSAPPT